MQGLLGGDHVDGVAAVLLVVEGEVLDGGDEALVLDAADHLAHQVGGQAGVLGEGLEVPARVRGADEVDHG